MLTGIVSPALLDILTKASETGLPTPLSPEYAREILEECRFDHVGQKARGSKTIPELLSVMNGGSWEPTVSELALARFPGGAIRLLNGHNRTGAMAQRDEPTATRVRIFDVNDDKDFALLYSRFDGATTLRGFHLRSGLQGFPVPARLFAGQGAGGGNAKPSTVAAAFIVDSKFGEHEQRIGVDGWKSLSAIYMPVFDGLRSVVRPARARAGNRRVLAAFDGTAVTAAFLSMWIADADACASFVRRLLGAEGDAEDTVRSRVWGALDNADSENKWRQARGNLSMAVIKAWANVLKGRSVGHFRTNPTGEYPIAGTKLVYRTPEAMRRWKTDRMAA